MIVYIYDKNNWFKKEHDCQPCPKTGGWLYPAEGIYTEIKPALTKGYAYQWDGKRWIEFEDNRKKVLYNKSTKNKVVCETIELPEDCTELEPKKCDVWDGKGWTKDIELVRADKYTETKQGFYNALANGIFMSETLKIEIDCRRNGTNNDLQNIQTLYDYMDRASIDSVEYIGYTEKKSASKSQIKDIIVEMGNYGLSLYKKKWELEEKIKKATKIDTLEKIIW